MSINAYLEFLEAEKEELEKVYNHYYYGWR